MTAAKWAETAAANSISGIDNAPKFFLLRWSIRYPAKLNDNYIFCRLWRQPVVASQRNLQAAGLAILEEANGSGPNASNRSAFTTTTTVDPS